MVKLEKRKMSKEEEGKEAFSAFAEEIHAGLSSGYRSLHPPLKGHELEAVLHVPTQFLGEEVEYCDRMIELRRKEIEGCHQEINQWKRYRTLLKERRLSG